MSFLLVVLFWRFWVYEQPTITPRTRVHEDRPNPDSPAVRRLR